jgi:hypothetical protein
MKMQNLWFIAIFGALASWANDEPIRINAETEAAFVSSYKAMEQSLNREERIRLYGAILRVRLQGIGSAEESRRILGGQPIRPIDVKDRIDGLTYEEILALAEESDVEAYPIE